jgi:hypothetical protein
LLQKTVVIQRSSERTATLIGLIRFIAFAGGCVIAAVYSVPYAILGYGIGQGAIVLMSEACVSVKMKALNIRLFVTTLPFPEQQLFEAHRLFFVYRTPIAHAEAEAKRGDRDAQGRAAQLQAIRKLADAFTLKYPAIYLFDKCEQHQRNRAVKS